MPSYWSYGLTVKTDCPIQGLSAVEDPREPDVRIRHASLPDVPATESSRPEAVRREDGLYFTWPDIGIYRVGGPGRITCDPGPDVGPRYAMEPVLGVLLGTVLHLRGICTLHASVVALEEDTDESQTGDEDTRGKAVAFFGWRGQGKSTTAAAFQQAGAPLLTDDVLAVEGLPGPEPLARPSFPRLKLSRKAADGLGYDWERLSELGGPLRKRAWTKGNGFCRERRPLAAIFRLDEGESVSCAQLSERDAVLALLRQSYAPRFLSSGEAGPQQLKWCSALARQVPVYRLERPRRFEAFPEVIDAVFEQAGARPAQTESSGESI